MLRICFALGVPFWFLRFAVCYHDSRPMLPIAFYPGIIMKILIFFVICRGHLDRVPGFLLCFFFNKSFYFGLLVFLYPTGTLLACYR